jgi:peptidoglycan/xylan/chitin deacetylase (PgdA/CDA1 family)
VSWLDPVRAALDDADAPYEFFFRDDDAGWDDEALGAVLDLFEARSLPVDVAVIPAELTSPLARSLAARAAGGVVRLHQHGLAHVNHEPAGRKCEFGLSRDLGAQLADISAGRDLLLDAFGDLVDPVFTPPWNRCSADTGAAVRAAGLRVLSRDTSAGRLDRADLAEVPVTVDWFAHRKGTRLSKDELSERIAAGVVAGGPVGVMLHHAVTDASEREAIDDLLALVAHHPAAAATNILALA